MPGSSRPCMLRPLRRQLQRLQLPNENWFFLQLIH